MWRLLFSILIGLQHKVDQSVGHRPRLHCHNRVFLITLYIVRQEQNKELLIDLRLIVQYFLNN